MKLNSVRPWLVVALLSLALCVLVHAAQTIRWYSPLGTPWVRITVGGTNAVEMGLRDDGIVVWREIATTTNSPAEKPAADNRIWFYEGATNIITNDVSGDKWCSPTYIP